MDKKLLSIPKDAIIDIQVSGGFYQNLQQLLYLIAEQKSVEEFTAAMNKVKSGKPTDLYEFQLATILGLIFEIESQAEKQNKLVQGEMPKPAEDSAPEV